MSLYIVLAATNLALWVAAILFRVGPAGHLFPVVAAGMLAADLFEKRESRRASCRAAEASATASEPGAKNLLVAQPILASGSTTRKPAFPLGMPVKQQSAELVSRSKFQQCSPRFRTEILDSYPDSTTKLVA